MAGPSKQVLWKWSNRTEILGQPAVDSNGVIYGIAVDGIVFALDSLGTEKWIHMLNGAANYRQVLLYGEHQFLLVVDMQGYKERWGEKGEVKDHVQAFRCGHDPGEKASFLWEADLPPLANIQVWGNRIIAVTHERSWVEMTEITIPKK